MPESDDTVAYLTWPRLCRHVAIAIAVLAIGVGVAINVIVHDETVFAATLVTIAVMLILLGRLARAALRVLLPELVRVNLVNHEYDHLNRPGSGWILNYRNFFELWALARERKRAGYD